MIEQQITKFPHRTVATIFLKYKIRLVAEERMCICNRDFVADQSETG
jgi:hypothetical protein